MVTCNLGMLMESLKVHHWEFHYKKKLGMR